MKYPYSKVKVEMIKLLAASVANDKIMAELDASRARCRDKMRGQAICENYSRVAANLGSS